MSAVCLAYRKDEAPNARPGDRLAGLADLGSCDIETSLVASLSGDLHQLFDPVSEDALPIYFGPLLGRLYLEGL